MNKPTDIYPSRIADEASIAPRRDPVVHTGNIASANAILDEPALNTFEQNGYLFFERLFDENEVARFQVELHELWSKVSESSCDAVIREPGTDIVRSVFAVHETNERFRCLLHDHRLVAMAEQILGSPVYIHQSRINYKTGFSGKDFYWHSDFETWHVEDGMPRMRALSVSIALSDNLSVNGPLMLIPGSHRHYVTCVGATPEDHFRQSLRRQEIGVPDDESLRWLADCGGIDAPVGPAGSVVLFDCNTMHGSNSNITPYPRSNIFAVYNSMENTLVAPFGGTKPRPDFIASRDFTAIRDVR